jgi:hypothetical protein
MSCSDIADRMLIRTAKLREMLRAYADGGNPFEEKKERKQQLPSLKGIEKLASLAEKKFILPLCSLIRKMANSEDKQEFEERCPVQLRRLVRAISMPTAISGFVLNPQLMGPLLVELGKGKPALSDATVLSKLQDNCPCLADILQCKLPGTGLSFPDELRPLLLRLGELVFKFAESMLLSTVDETVGFVSDVPQEDQSVPDRQPISIKEGKFSLRVVNSIPHSARRS